MKDPYQPSIASFVISSEEQEAIEVALSHANPWDHDAWPLRPFRNKLKSVKQKIRDFHMQRQGNNCCYCKVNIYGVGPFGVDQEHVLPKSKFKDLSYTISNLSVSCKPCNMEMKGSRVDFLVDSDAVHMQHESSDQYLIVHPNLDRWSDFLDRKSEQTVTATLVKYKILGCQPKGKFTYDFFKLSRLEVDSFNVAQGKPGLSDREVGYIQRLKNIMDNMAIRPIDVSNGLRRSKEFGRGRLDDYIRSAFGEGVCTCYRCISSGGDELGYEHQHTYDVDGRLINRRFAQTNREEFEGILSRAWLTRFKSTPPDGGFKLEDIQGLVHPSLRYRVEPLVRALGVRLR